MCGEGIAILGFFLGVIHLLGLGRREGERERERDREREERGRERERDLKQLIIRSVLQSSFN